MARRRRVKAYRSAASRRAAQQALSVANGKRGNVPARSWRQLWPGAKLFHDSEQNGQYRKVRP